MVRSLFSAGEQGVWYDPSDLSTMYQDAAGTISVTAVGQPVGLILDKSKNGVGKNGAKRVNLLQNTEELTAAAWLKQNLTVTGNATTAPDGSLSADLYVVNFSSTAINNDLYQSFSGLIASREYVYRVCLKTAGARYVQIILNRTSFVNDAYVNVDLFSGSFVFIGSGILSSSISPAGYGFFEIKITANSSATISSQFIEHIIVPAPNSPKYTSSPSNGTDGVYLWGSDPGLPHSNIIKASGQACSCVNHHPRQRLCAAGADWSSSFQAERAG